MKLILVEERAESFNRVLKEYLSQGYKPRYDTYRLTYTPKTEREICYSTHSIILELK